MASSVIYLTRMGLTIANSNITRQFDKIATKTLYTKASMGINDYMTTRDQVAKKYQSAIDGFKLKLQNNINEENRLIFTEDVKTFLHLAENETTDIVLLTKVLEKFTSQDSEIRFGSFKFGPVVMRTFHYLNEPNVAFELFMNPRYKTFFNQMTSFMILLDLLYENKMYKEVRETYNYIMSEMLTNSRHPKLPLSVLAMSCYKENTPESLQVAMKVCEDLSNSGAIPIRRVIATFGALALNQNKPHVALELTSLCRTIEYISIRCIRVMAFADLDRIDDIVLEFQAALRRGLPNNFNYYSDIVPKVEAAIERLNVPESAEIVQLLQILQDRGFITKMTMDEHLSHPLETSKPENSQGKYHDGGWSDSRRGTNYSGDYLVDRNNGKNYRNQQQFSA